MALNKTIDGPDAAVYIVDTEKKRVVDILPFPACNGCTPKYRNILNTTIMATYFIYLKEYL